jgi:hypothetical protein
MPPARRKPKATEPSYRWTAGGVAEIRRLGLIAHGGYGEVHKVGTQVRSS